MSGFNWLNFTSKLLASIPIAVFGVEAIAKPQPGTTKKQMALTTLGLSDAVASIVAPQYKAAIDAAAQMASDAIDGVVATANATGWEAAAQVGHLATVEVPDVIGTLAAIHHPGNDTQQAPAPVPVATHEDDLTRPAGAGAATTEPAAVEAAARGGASNVTQFPDAPETQPDAGHSSPVSDAGSHKLFGSK